MTASEIVRSERILYCKLAECEDWVSNMFKCRRFYTGNVVDGAMETVGTFDLVQGDIIYFIPISPVKPMHDPMLGQPILAVVHSVTESGTIALGNMNMTRAQLEKLSDHHVSGRF